jgi:exodeoxyribonuclease VII large subunit
LTTFVQNQIDLIAQLRSRPILANPYTFIDEQSIEIERSLFLIRDRIDQKLTRESMHIGHLRQQVRSLSPQSTLDRGYSVVRDAQGHVVADADQVKSGQKLRIRLAKGELAVTAD